MKTIPQHPTRSHRRRLRPVDGVGRLAVDTVAVASPLGIPAAPPASPPISVAAVAAVAAAPVTEKEHFGSLLRRARESRGITLAAVTQTTKVARSTLEVLERGDLDLMPTGVYARGFIRAFARAVGVDETEPLLLYERAVEARSAAEKTRSSTPVLEIPELTGGATEDESITPRRGLGLAVFVIILLVIATITLSLLLRRPPPTGEGLSVAPPPHPAAIAPPRVT